MDRMPQVIALEQVSVRQQGRTILDNINLKIHKDQQWAVVGKSGSGKSTLAAVLADRIFYTGKVIHPDDARSSRITLIEQQHRFKNLTNTSEFYYQQRFN